MKGMEGREREGRKPGGEKGKKPDERERRTEH